jgi:hypothetical protein
MAKLLGSYTFRDTDGDLYRGHSLSNAEREKFNLYIKTTSESTYEVWMDTKEMCNLLHINPPLSEEAKIHFSSVEKLNREIVNLVQSERIEELLDQIERLNASRPFVPEYYFKYG